MKIEMPKPKFFSPEEIKAMENVPGAYPSRTAQQGASIVDEQAKTISRLRKVVEDRERELRRCVNELCLQCGRYHEEHTGACDGCRWLPIRNGGVQRDTGTDEES